MTTIPQAYEPSAYLDKVDTATQTERSEDLVRYLQIARWATTPAPATTTFAHRKKAHETYVESALSTLSTPRLRNMQTWRS